MTTYFYCAHFFFFLKSIKIEKKLKVVVKSKRVTALLFNVCVEQCFSTGVPWHTSVPSNFLGVPPNLKIVNKVCENNHIFIFLVSFLPLSVPPKFNFFQNKSATGSKKVENHWCWGSMVVVKVSMMACADPRSLI